MMSALAVSGCETDSAQIGGATATSSVSGTKTGAVAAGIRGPRPNATCKSTHGKLYKNCDKEQT
jgi:hypothetical protein